MKLISFTIFLFICSLSFSQSISATKIISFLGSQDCEEISQELESLGFEYDGENKISETFIAQTYFINTTYGLETFNFAKNDELFAIVYNIANNDFLEIIKSKLVTNEFSFTYSYNNVNFYENSKMRIGINEKYNILSFFVALK